jgi:hypothetical protein
VGHGLPVDCVIHCSTTLTVLGVCAVERTHEGVHPRHRQREVRAVESTLTRCAARGDDIRGSNGLLHQRNRNQNVRAVDAHRLKRR